MDDGSQLLKALNVLMLKILVSVPMMFTYLLQLIVYQKIKVSLFQVIEISLTISDCIHRTMLSAHRLLLC